MTLVFQNIDPPPPSPPGECVVCTPRLCGGGGGGRTHSPGGEGGGRSIFWKTRDIGLPSHSNNLSTNLAYDISPGQYGIVSTMPFLVILTMLTTLNTS